MKRQLRNSAGLKDLDFSRPVLVAFALIFAAFGGYVIYRSFAAASCTATVSSVSAAQSAVSSAAGGSTICISAGSYGSITLTGSHSSNVTFEPDPAADPNGAGKVTFSGITITGTYITVHNFYSTGGINLGPPAAHDVVDHNDVTNGAGGYGVNVSCNGASSQPGCSYITINGNRVHDLGSTSDDGDAIRLDGWANVAVTYNEITRVEQHSGSNQGHTDCLQSYNAGVGTHDIVYDHNYVHDTQCQVFFLKDGDVSNVTVTNNLAVRADNNGETDTAIWLDENTPGAVIRNNTLQNTGGSAIQAGGSASGSSATVTYNVFDVFNQLGGYNLTENHNIFTDGNQWSFTPNSTDQPTSYGVTVHPAFMCGSSCGNGTKAGDDYRLASNPNGIGIDWAPSQYTYGPVNDGGSGGGGSTPAPTVTISANPTSVSAGGSATLTWSTTNATSCTASGAWSGSKATSGSASTGAVNTTSTFSLSCTGAGGSANGSATVTVTSAQTSRCFASPGACGYPDPAFGNVGVPSGTTLTPSGSITVTTAGTVINGLDVTGTIDIAANNVTIKNTRVTNSDSNGYYAVNVESGVTGTVIQDSTIRGSGQNEPQALDLGVVGSGATMNRVYIYNCGECINGSNFTINDSYVQVTPGSQPGEHFEDVYLNNSSFTANHDTLLNPQNQTAVVFADTNLGSGGACSNHITVKNSLLAGGGFMFYTCGNASSVGSATMDVENNRLAKCLTTAVYNSSSGGYSCSGGSDTSGYYPKGGYFGMTLMTYCPPQTSQIWSNNVWDDSTQIVNCDGSSGGSGGGGDSTPPTVSITAPANNATISGNSVALSATASDNVGVTSVQFKLDGNPIGSADTSSPYTGTLNTTTVSNGTHTISALVSDAAGNTGTATITVTVSNAGSSCVQSTTGWQNGSFASQTGSFTVNFDTTPLSNNMNGVLGLSSGAATDYSNLGPIVRFNPDGAIDARNGDNYGSDNTVNYTANTTYHVKMVVNVSVHTYTVYVTPAGGSQVTLATNYAFRTEQAGVSNLSNWAVKNETGTHSVCNFSLAAVTVVGDLNGDGLVNIFDLSILLSNYGKAGNAAQGDLNGDGTVNIFDLSILLSHYSS